MLWYSGRSLPLPAYSVVATLNWVTCLPLASARISGSRVRRPARRTLFTFAGLLPWSADGTRADPACGGSMARRDGWSLGRRAYPTLIARSSRTYLWAPWGQSPGPITPPWADET